MRYSSDATTLSSARVACWSCGAFSVGLPCGNSTESVSKTRSASSLPLERRLRSQIPEAVTSLCSRWNILLQRSAEHLVDP